MKSAVFYGPHDIRVEDVPVPETGSDEVLIRVKACGVCGTDIHIFEGDKGAADTFPPCILGHEFSGVIEKTGRKELHYKGKSRRRELQGRRQSMRGS
jgi:threonine dehydrogenase-like Zn-dependent dehydrogenase